MRTRILFLLLLSIFAQADVHDSSTKSREVIQNEAVIPEEEVALGNAIRNVLKEHNREVPGQYTPALCEISRKQNDLMQQSNVFTHDINIYDSNRRPLRYDTNVKLQRAIQLGGSAYGENIAMHGYGNTLEEKAKYCADMWWKSSGHRANMLGNFDNFCHSMKIVGNRTWCTSSFSKKIPLNRKPQTEENTAKKVPTPNPFVQNPNEPLPLNAAASEEANNPFPNLRVAPTQTHGKDIHGRVVPIYFDPATSRPIGGANGEYQLKDETVDELFHFYKLGTRGQNDTHVQRFLRNAAKPNPNNKFNAEPWPNWQCKEAPLVKDMKPITKSGLQILTKFKDGSDSSCTASMISKQKLADGTCEFGMASAAHCMITDSAMKNDKFSNDQLVSISTRFGGTIPVTKDNLSFPRDYQGWMKDHSAKSDVALIRFRSSCDTVADNNILPISDEMPPKGATISMGRQDESFVTGTVTSPEDNYGDVVANLSGFGKRGDSGGGIVYNGRLVGVLGRTPFYFNEGNGIPESGVYFNQIKFLKDGIRWLKRTLASCNKEAQPERKLDTSPAKPQTQTQTSTVQPASENKIEWRADGMWGKDKNGQSVPLVFSNQTGELLGGENGEHQLPDATSQALYDYIQTHPGRFSETEKAQLKPFISYWENKMGKAQQRKTQIPLPLEEKVETKSAFECVSSEGGFRPRFIQASANGTRYKALGASPMRSEEECKKALANSNNGIICSYTGIGYKPTHFSGYNSVRRDYGYYGTSIKSLDLCLKATLNSTEKEVCHWNDGNWIISNIQTGQYTRGNYANLDSCLQGLGASAAKPNPVAEKKVPTPLPAVAETKPTIETPNPHSGLYGNYCASCHNDDKAASFPSWLLDKDKLAAALTSADTKTKSFAEEWASKLNKYLVQNDSMPPKSGNSKALHEQAANDKKMQELKAFLSAYKNEKISAPSRARNHVQLLSNNNEAAYRAILPQVNDNEIQNALNDPDTIFYDQNTLPAAYQDDSNPVIGVRTTEHPTFVRGAPFRDEKTGKLKVFSHGVGIDPKGNTKTYHFLSLPKDGNGDLTKIKIWTENKRGSISNAPLWNWEFPAGTVSGEVVYQTDSKGNSTVLEVRTRKKLANGKTEPDIFVAAPSKADLLERLNEVKTSNPALREEANKVEQSLQETNLAAAAVSARGYRVPGIGHQGFTEKLPPMSEDLVHAISATSYKSSRGTVWDASQNQEAFSPTTDQSFGLVPQNSTRGALPVDTKSCANCHDRTNFPIRDLYGKNPHDMETLLNNTTVLYGNTPGSDGNLRWHPFDPKLLPRFSDLPDNRKIRDEFKPIVEVIRK